MKLLEPLHQELKLALRGASKLREEMDRERGESAKREEALAREQGRLREAQAERGRLEQELKQARAEAARLKEDLGRERERTREAEARLADTGRLDAKLSALQESLARKPAEAPAAGIGTKSAELQALVRRLADQIDRQGQVVLDGVTRKLALQPTPAAGGGLWLVQEFLRRLRLKDLIREHIRINPDAAEDSPSDRIEAILLALIAGLRRADRTEVMQNDGAFLDILGLSRFPDRNGLRRFLGRLAPPEIDRIGALHDDLRSYLGTIPRKRDRLVLDVDAVVCAVPGQGARRSFHPLFCFEATFREFWHGVLRPGKSGATAGAVPFLQACTAKAPKGTGPSRIRFRLDERFCDPAVLAYLARSRCGYVMPARDNPTLRLAVSRGRYRRLANGWNAAEYRERIDPAAARPSRFVVVRRPVPREGSALDLPPLFREKNHVYYVFVTNLKDSPWQVYEFYRSRATVVKDVRDALASSPLADLPPNRWAACEAFFRLQMLAADLVHWFRRLCLPREYQNASLASIRNDLLLIPAQLVTCGGKNLLFLPRDAHAREEFQKAARSVAQLRLPPRFVSSVSEPRSTAGRKGPARKAARVAKKAPGDTTAQIPGSPAVRKEGGDAVPAAAPPPSPPPPPPS